MAGISSKAAGKFENRFLFNNGTEFETKEFSDGGGLDSYSTDFRSYDPQKGTFLQIDPMGDETEQYSPYLFGNNNPLLLNDPLGLSADTVWKPLTPVVVTATKYKNTPSSHDNLPGSIASIALPLGGTGMGLGTGVSTVSSATGIGAMVVGGILASIKVDELARRRAEKRWYITYYKRGPRGRIYVGRCSGEGNTPEEVLERYDKNHRLNPIYNKAQIDAAVNGSVWTSMPMSVGTGVVLPISEISGYSAIRGREQQLYDYFKNQGIEMGNIQRPVWKYNPLGSTYHAASNLTFGPLAEFKGQF